MLASLLVAISTTGGQAAAARTPGEVVSYQFADGSGSIVTDSGSGTPLDLTIADPGNVTWNPGGGLTIDSPTMIASPGGADKVVNAVQASGAFTVEAWVEPAPGEQEGPARIVSSGPDTKKRNFMLGQGAFGGRPDDVFAARTRTTDNNKGLPTLFTPAGTAVPTQLTHVVLTRDVAGNRLIYVDGSLSTSDVLGGTTANWDASFPLTLGNAGGGSRPWLGTFCLAAIYDSALTPTQVADNFAAGCGQPNTDPVLAGVGDQSGAEGDVVSVVVSGSDGDGDPLTFGATDLPDGLTIASTGPTSAEITGTISQTAATGSVYSTEITVDDGKGGSDSETLAWTVAAVNVDPVLTPVGDQVSAENQVVSLTVLASDVDNDTLTFAATGLPPSLSIDSGTGVISGTIDPGPASYTVVISVDDNAGGSDSETINWDVTTDPGSDALIRYQFNEGSGTTVSDSGSGAPLDLTIEDPANVTWVPGGGLTIDVETVISSPESSKLVNAVQASGEFTVAAWIKPAAGEQDGPARIVSNSPNSKNRNFMVGQGAFAGLPDDTFAFRSRTSSSNKGTPNLFSPEGTAIPETLTHVVMSRDAAGNRTIYLNGQPVITDVLAGTTDNWDPSFALTLGNVASGKREWLGTYCEVAIYDSALSAAEVADNFSAGCDLPGPAAEALVQITPGGVIDATTFGDSTITATNTGVTGAPAIVDVSFDLRGSLIPDATFDPIGTAGDAGTQCLAVSVEGGTGFAVPGDPCTDPFSLQHEDAPGVPGNGWDGMTLDFTNFDAGESIVFGVDVDPTTIQGVPGSGGAGAVSGLELTGSSVTVTFSDGQSLTGSLFGDGSAGGAQAVVSSAIGQLMPTNIEMLNVITSPTVFPNSSRAGNVPSTGAQTVRVSGPDGATVNLLSVTGDLQSPAPFDPDPFESDAATAAVYSTGTIAGGFVDFPVTLADDTKRYHYVAAIDDGANGKTSEQLVIEIGDTDTPVIDPIAVAAVDEGDTVSIPINATDPNGDTITLGISSNPDIEALGAVLTDNGDGTGSLDWVTEVGDAGSYDVDITATDGTNTATESFVITVLDGSVTVLHRVNSGGPTVTATDGGPDWSEDQVTSAANAGGTAATGSPSPYWVAGEEKAYGTADTINLGDASVPGGTPQALFQTERWDPAGGAELVYEFPVGSGVAYVVDLYMAEIFATADGIREFSVAIEGTTVLTNYDVHSLVGHDAGLVETFVSPVIADDFLTISFTHEVENPKVNAIEIRTAGPPPVDVPPTLGAIADQSVQVGSSLPVAITSTEPDGDTVTLGYSSTPDASAFTTFVDNTDGSGSLTFAPTAGQAGVYNIDVTATDVDGTDTESFTLTVSDPPVGGTVYARINSAGPLVAAIDGGPDWEADANPGHPFLSSGGSNGNAGFPAVEPGATVPASVPGAIFDTERFSTSQFTYGVPVPAGTQATIRLFLGNGFPDTSAPGERVFDIAIDGVTVEDDFDIIPAFGHEVGGMLEYLVTSDGTVDISFIQDVIQNPLVNGIEVVAATSAPDQLGATPSNVNFGNTLVNGSASQAVSLSNLGFEAGDPSITVTAVTAAGGEFTTDFSGPVTLGPAGSSPFNVTFAPTTVGPQAGTLTVDHSGSNSPVTVNLNGTGSNNIPVSFTSTGLSGETSTNPTSLQFGPDGRLYVAQQDATIKAYTVQRNSATDYAVTATETINIIKTDTTNHDDDGTTSSLTTRQMTGLLATGTSANPVLYVTSSDSRIAVGNDTGLDTNSGIVTRLTWNGASWDKVDLVRGLPRSEENHSTNGLALDENTNTLYVMQGGHANKGAPGNNFSGTPEYYLSAAMLSVDLDAINALGTFTDSRDGATVAYDLRTLDDPSRPNITNASPDFPYSAGHPLFNASIDVGDPFGGNNGLNQAIPEPGGPVQIHSPGYRNAFDVVYTSQGRLYTSDNGPNTGWGGLPLVYDSGGSPKGTGPFDQGAGDYCTNEFNESGSNGHGDPLHFVSGLGYYGGHPTPIRAFPDLSGVIVYENQGGWTETASHNFYDLLPPDLSAANFPSNPIECEYSSNNPGKYVDIISASTNGITEYTASNFGGALQGNILTASFNGNIYSYQMNAAGDAFTSKQSLFSGFGSQPLDVTAQGDGEPFPGTVWAVTYGANNVTVFEPSDSTGCTGADSLILDEDGDGYSNADEIDNGTDPCSGGDKPPDNDGDNLSDLNDDDDDNDGILDVNDPFALDPDNGLTTSIPVLRPFLNNDPGTFFFGLGLTGLMTNGATDYLDQFDPTQLNAGGNGGQFGVEVVTAGDAYQGVNTQDNAFQYGIDADTTTAPFIVKTSVLPPLFDGLTPGNFQSAGVQIGTGDQENYLKMVVNANGGAGGIEVLKEEAGVASGTVYGAAAIGGDVLAATSSIELNLIVDPAALTVQPQTSIDGGTPVNIGPPVSIPASWLDGADTQGLAVGLISTSTGPGPEFAASWDYLDVEFFTATNDPPTIDPIADQTVEETNNFSLTVVANDADPLTYALSGDVPAGMTIDGSGVIDYTPDLTGSGSYAVTVEVDDGTNPVVTEDFVLDVTQAAPLGSAIHRINVGGLAVAAADGTFPDWAVDTNTDPSPFRTGGSNNIFGPGVGISDITHPTVPGTVPQEVFEVERFDTPTGTEMTWALPVTAGTEVEVRLYWAELFGGIDAAGERVIDVEIDGVVVETGIDPFAEVGPGAGYVTDYLVTSDGTIDIVLLHNVENPALKGIEILGVSGVPAIELLAPLDGATITADQVTVEWALNGFLDPNDHVHVTLDAPPHTSVFRPDTTFDLTGLSAGVHTLTVEVADVAHTVYTNPEASQTITFTVDLGPVLQDDPTVEHYAYGDALFRVNAGGPEVASLDGGPAWSIDTAGSPSPYLGGGPVNISATGATPNLDPSVPATTPSSVFGTERWDPNGGSDMEWNFPVTAGTPVAVRLYFADFNGPTQSPGARVFDVSIDGSLALDDYDIFVDAGANTGVMKEIVVVADTDGLDIDFGRVVENPEVRAIEIVALLDDITGFGDFDFVTVIGNPATNSENVDITGVDETLDGPAGAPGTPASVAGSCLPSIPATVAPGDTIECRFTLNITGADNDVFNDAVNATGTFSGGQSVDVDSLPVDVTLSVPAPITTRINAAGPLVTSIDAGPDWEADDTGHPTLSVASGSSLGGFAIGGFHGSVPAYGQINDLYLTERWDPSNGTDPDLVTYTIPVSQAGASATVNLLMMNGWPGSSAPGQRLFDVYIEGNQVLDEFDLVVAYGHQTGGMESFAVTDDGDGFITIQFDHGAVQNPLVNAIEVIG